MVLTTAQTTSFFENIDQMGIQHAMVVQLALEGIDATKQNGEVAAVTYSPIKAKRLPIALKSILKQAKNGSS